ncbi:cytochrome P450 [Striga asiatica]|uniref:Cytochrome P450 n=1 Tax=Striga asiatica TaxID=4170 RepID=A0A5A7RC02_STRAF|nr:cytochrome P450 [Striga asiatica]
MAPSPSSASASAPSSSSSPPPPPRTASPETTSSSPTAPACSPTSTSTTTTPLSSGPPPPPLRTASPEMTSSSPTAPVCSSTSTSTTTTPLSSGPPMATTGGTSAGFPRSRSSPATSSSRVTRSGPRAQIHDQGPEARAHGFALDMKTAFFELTMNVVMRMIAGKRYYGENVEDAEEARQFRKIAKESLRVSTSSTGDFLSVVRWLGLGSGEKKMIELQAKRDGFMQGLVEEGRRRSVGGGKSKTMIEMLLALQESEPQYYIDAIIRSLMLEWKSIPQAFGELDLWVEESSRCNLGGETLGKRSRTKSPAEIVEEQRPPLGKSGF